MPELLSPEEPITEPFGKCQTIAPPEVDYPRQVVLLTLKLAPHSVPELYHTTGIPIVVLGRIITALMKERLVHTSQGSAGAATKFAAMPINQSEPATPGFLPLARSL